MRRSAFLRADAAAEFASNHLLFVMQGALFAQDFDPTGMTLSGEPFRGRGSGKCRCGHEFGGRLRLRRGIHGLSHGFGRQPAAVCVVRPPWQGNERVGEPDSSGVLGPALSSDGRHVAMYRTVDGNSDIWLLELERGVRERFTMDAAGDVNPVWSPDRQRIAVQLEPRWRYDLYVKTVSSSDTSFS
jgi:hypothetical protein